MKFHSMTLTVCQNNKHVAVHNIGKTLFEFREHIFYVGGGSRDGSIHDKYDCVDVRKISNAAENLFDIFAILQ